MKRVSKILYLCLVFVCFFGITVQAHQLSFVSLEIKEVIESEEELSQGCIGKAVEVIQQFLIDCGYLKDVVDGSFGPLTNEAVLLFQRNEGYEPNGILTQEMKKKLSKATPITEEERKELLKYSHLRLRR